MTEPVHIGEVLPGVLADIRRRMDRYAESQRAQEEHDRRTRIFKAMAGFHRGQKNSRQANRARRPEDIHLLSSLAKDYEALSDGGTDENESCSQGTRSTTHGR